MPFYPHSHIPQMPHGPPDSVPIGDFLFGEASEASEANRGRYPLAESRPPFTCGVTGKTHSAVEVAERIQYLARALGRELGVAVDAGEPLDKVVDVYSVNTIDTLTVSWAIHRLNGVSAPVSSHLGAPELIRHINLVKCKAIFTSIPGLAASLEAAAATGLSKKHIYLLEVPDRLVDGAAVPTGFKTVDQLIEEGRSLPPLPEVQWSAGQGARQTAFLMSSSGTSGPPKVARLSHHNIVFSVMQRSAMESLFRPAEPGADLVVAPFSHAASLIVAGHHGVYLGHEHVVMPEFDLLDVFKNIDAYKIRSMFMVPSMVLAMTRGISLARPYSLGSLQFILSGGAPMTKDLHAQFSRLVPGCRLVNAYGMTEMSGTSLEHVYDDDMVGSCGQLLPGYEARLIDADGGDVQGYDVPGELVVKSPAVIPGYLDNEEANAAAFWGDGWLRTGDLFEARRSDAGYEHFFYVDRVKELIKVRGMQVSPSELEGVLIRHPSVADAAVVAIPSDAAGELPLAFIVRSAAGRGEGEAAVRSKINDHVGAELADYKRLAGGIEFLDALPKTSSGKTQRGEVRALARGVLERRARGGMPAVIQSFEFGSDEDEEEEKEEQEQ